MCDLRLFYCFLASSDSIILSFVHDFHISDTYVRVKEIKVFASQLNHYLQVVCGLLRRWKRYESAECESEEVRKEGKERDVSGRVGICG